MKRILFLVLLALTLNGCATLSGTPATPAAVVSAQDAATQSLYAIGALLQATPGVLDSLYAADKLSKTDYNSAVVVYNQALASFNVACEALKVAVKAEQDPASVTAYVQALQAFLGDKVFLDNMMLEIGAQPIGKGVNP